MRIGTKQAGFPVKFCDTGNPAEFPRHKKCCQKKERRRRLFAGAAVFSLFLAVLISFLQIAAVSLAQDAEITKIRQVF